MIKKMVVLFPVLILVFIFSPKEIVKAVDMYPCAILPGLPGDPGCGGGGGSLPDPVDPYKIDVGGINSTSSISGRYTSGYSQRIYNFTPPKSGYYKISFTTDAPTYASFSVKLYKVSYDILAQGNNNDAYNYGYETNYVYDEINYDRHELNQYLTGGTKYYLKVENTMPAYVNFTLNIYRNDDTIEGHPIALNVNVPLNSSIDYVGDIDYYTFTNKDIIYDIYSTGQGSGNIDMKAELFLCEDSNCNTKTKIVENDDHGSLSVSDKIEKISYSDMGIYDFGFRVNLGFENIGKEYILKVSPYNGNITGNYTLNIENTNDTTVEDVIDLDNIGSPNDPLKISVTNNDIYINLYVEFTGNPDIIIDTVTARQAVIDGFNYWSNNGNTINILNNKVTVHVEVHDKDDGNYNTGQQFFKVDVNDHAGRPHVNLPNYLGWQRENPGTIYLYTQSDGYPWSPIIDFPHKQSGDYYNLTEFKKIAAHELGHVLGLDDAYDEEYGNDIFNFDRPAASETLGVDFNGWMLYTSSVGNQYNADILESHEIEMRMVLYAYYINERQYFVSYEMFKIGFIDFVQVKQSMSLNGFEGTIS